LVNSDHLTNSQLLSSLAHPAPMPLADGVTGSRGNHDVVRVSAVLLGDDVGGAGGAKWKKSNGGRQISSLSNNVFDLLRGKFREGSLSHGKQEWSKLFASVDKSHSGSLDIGELLSCVRRVLHLTPTQISDDKGRDLFGMLDVGGSGSLALDDLLRFLNDVDDPEVGEAATKIQSHWRRVMVAVNVTVKFTMAGFEKRDTNYKEDGNMEHYTEDAVAKRKRLRHDPKIVAGLEKFYACFETSRSGCAVCDGDYPQEIPRAELIDVQVRMCRALFSDEDWNLTEARQAAEEDWEREVGAAGTSMPRETFLDSLFELADIWTLEVDRDEYDASSASSSIASRRC
jgi:hypothetical protein